MEAQSTPKNGLAIASLVLGIVGLVFSVIPGLSLIGASLGVVGLILAIVANKKGKSGAAKAGLILSIIAIVLGVAFYVACVACAAALNQAGIDAINQAASSIQ